MKSVYPQPSSSKYMSSSKYDLSLAIKAPRDRSYGKDYVRAVVLHIAQVRVGVGRGDSIKYQCSGSAPDLVRRF